MIETSILFISLLSSVLLFILPFRYSFLVYLAVLLYVPDYIRIVGGGFTVSSGRIVVLFLLLRCFWDPATLKKFQWNLLDTMIVATDLLFLGALSFTSSDLFSDIKFRCGLMMDTTFAYFAARLFITNMDRLVLVVQYAVFLLIPHVGMGLVEATTAQGPYTGLLVHRFYADRTLGVQKFEASGAEGRGHAGEKRMGFYRSQGSFAHPILFGLTFALFMPLAFKIIPFTRWRRWRYFIFCLLGIGCLTSLSSGPIMALGIVIVGLFAEKYKSMVSVAVILFVCLCVFLELVTNRPHFYHVFASYLAMEEETAYARTRLFDAAIEHLHEYWLFGYGLKDPGWGQYVSGTNYTDLCVYYIYLAATYGIMAAIFYIFCLFYVIVRLWILHERCRQALFKSVFWGIIVAVLAIVVGNLSVTPFGALNPLYCIVLGLAGSVFSGKETRSACIPLPQTSHLL